jgi:hypothetical protein
LNIQSYDILMKNNKFIERKRQSSHTQKIIQENRIP